MSYRHLDSGVPTRYLLGDLVPARVSEADALVKGLAVRDFELSASHMEGTDLRTNVL